MIKASVIIPMYNESRYINRCLDSLINQSCKDFEVILIDDWSTDNTINIAEEYKKKFILTILKQKHWWPGKARNRWAKEAKWDILIFVDADMKFDKKYIEELTKPILSGEEMWTAHGWEYVANLENKIARAFSNIRCIYNPMKTRWWIYRAILKKTFLGAWWFDTSRWYGDDNLSKLWNALSIPSAIVYHNNPESLHEVFKHSMRVGSSLWKTWDILVYLKKYRLWIVGFLIILIILSYFLLKQWIFYLLPIGIVWLIVLFIIIKTTQRTLTEKYLSDIIFIPIVMVTRWLGYISGALKYIFSKKLY